MSKNSRQQPVFGAAPRANLLPPQQRADLIHERTLPKLLIAIIAAGLAAAVFAIAGMWSVGLADVRLSDAQGATEELNQAFAEHSELHHTRQDIDVISRYLVDLDSGQTLYMEVFDLVRDALPDESMIQEFQASPAGGEASASMLCGAGAFAVTVTEQTPDVAAANEFVRELAGLDASVCAEATALSANPGENHVTASVQMMLDDSIAGMRSGEEAK